MLLAVFVGLAWLMWGRMMVADAKAAENVMRLDEKEAISNPRLLVSCAVVLLLVLAGFVTHSITHIDPSIVALLGAGVLVAVSRLGPKEFLEDVEWSTLVFFMGLFMLVGSLVHVGVIEQLGRWLAESVGDRLVLPGRGITAPGACRLRRARRRRRSRSAATAVRPAGMAPAGAAGFRRRGAWPA